VQRAALEEWWLVLLNRHVRRVAAVVEETEALLAPLEPVAPIAGDADGVSRLEDGLTYLDLALSSR
jgi:hypothetical protein